MPASLVSGALALAYLPSHHRVGRSHELLSDIVDNAPCGILIVPELDPPCSFCCRPLAVSVLLPVPGLDVDVDQSQSPQCTTTSETPISEHICGSSTNGCNSYSGVIVCRTSRIEQQPRSALDELLSKELPRWAAARVAAQQ